MYQVNDSRATHWLQWSGKVTFCSQVSLLQSWRWNFPMIVWCRGCLCANPSTSPVCAHFEPSWSSHGPGAIPWNTKIFSREAVVVTEGIQPLFSPKETVPSTAELQILLSCHSVTAVLRCSVSGGKVEDDFSMWSHMRGFRQTACNYPSWSWAKQRICGSPSAGLFSALQMRDFHRTCWN